VPQGIYYVTAFAVPLSSATSEPQFATVLNCVEYGWLPQSVSFHAAAVVSWIFGKCCNDIVIVSVNWCSGSIYQFCDGSGLRPGVAAKQHEKRWIFKGRSRVPD
jgi:hypothetical protein